MANKILILLLVCAACGRDVKVDNSKLESYSQVTEAEALKLSSDGVLKRTGTEALASELTYKNTTYKIHAGSSYLALTYLSSLSNGSSTSVTFVGKIKGKEIVLEEIKSI